MSDTTKAGRQADPHADVDHRFGYHPPSTDQVRLAHEAVRGECRALAHTFEGLLPPGDEKSRAMTKLEEAMFWANAAVARGQ